MTAKLIETLTPEQEQAIKNAKNAYHKEWQKKNPDKVRAQAKAWRDKNKDKIKIYNSRYWLKKASQSMTGSDTKTDSEGV